MGWPYHFVSLDDWQQVRRRQLLDSYGQFAQFSILLLPLIYQLSLGVQLLFGRLQRRHDYEPVKEHQSPVVSGFRQPAIDGTGNALAKLRWALDEPVAQGWETRKEWLTILVWGAWLLLLVLKDTGDGESDILLPAFQGHRTISSAKVLELLSLIVKPHSCLSYL
jgi:hypothetical protein